MSHIAKNNALPLFLTMEEAVKRCQDKLGINIDFEYINSLIRVHLLPTFESDGNNFVLVDDFDSLLPVLAEMGVSNNIKFLSEDLFGKKIPRSIIPRKNTSIELIRSTEMDPAFYAASRNLILTAQQCEDKELEEQICMEYYPPTRFLTSSIKLKKFTERQLSRFELIVRSKGGQFTNSAYYMGSKKALVGFLVEAIHGILPQDGIVVDLMCGSGVAAGSFSKIWRTFASDAQQFCTTLAKVQGGGFSVKKAKFLLSTISPIIQNHARQLSNSLGMFLDWEDKLFHSCTGPQLLEEYRSFIEQFPTYPSNSSRNNWNPRQEVEKRKKDPSLLPYCLFTAYFANVYFGLRQCIEIDSVRYAIDQLETGYERQWALGALIPTLSALGTTYGGHFAQPRIKKPSDLTIGNFAKILESRSFSIIHEFSVRLLNLAGESEKSPNSVNIVEGPWDRALSALDKLIGTRPVVVYIDPPYKREEYSRYYHVLETAISYSYPACIGVGRTPDKHKGERFESEFFTRSESKLTESLVLIISEILQRNWICAWSYSDVGDANIVTVINKVHKVTKCKVKSFATPHEHKSQGGKQHKKVIEYLILFLPDSNCR